VDAEVRRVPEQVAEQTQAAGDEREMDEHIVHDERRLGRLAE